MIYLPVDDSITIVPLTERDSKTLYLLLNKNKAYLSKWINWVSKIKKESHLVSLIRKWRNPISLDQGFHSGIYYKNRLVGMIGLNYIDMRDRVTEMAYWLDEGSQGKGIMTKSCYALMHFLFEQWGLNKVEIHVASLNERSRAIPERLGFTPEKCLRRAEWLRGRFVDHVVYSMYHKQFKRRN